MHTGNFVEMKGNVPQNMVYLLGDAQTSGGLLVALPAAQADRLLKKLHQSGIRRAAVIGGITEGEPSIKVHA
jgi:hypothetical protein